MKYKDLFLTIWVPIIIFIHIVIYLFTCNILCLFTSVTLIAFLTIEGETGKKTYPKSSSVSIASQTDIPYKSHTKRKEEFKKHQTEKPTTAEIGSQTDPLVLINVFTQTTNEKFLVEHSEENKKEIISIKEVENSQNNLTFPEKTKTEMGSQTNSRVFMNAYAQTTNGTFLMDHNEENKKETISIPKIIKEDEKSQKNKIFPEKTITREKESQTIPPISFTEGESIEEDESKPRHQDKCDSFPLQDQNIADDPYFSLPQLSTLPSSSADLPGNKKKTNSWKKLKKSIKKYPVPTNYSNTNS